MNTDAVTSFDRHLDGLGHVDRRWPLLAFLNAEEAALPIELDQLECDTAESDVLLSFHHNHLPRLEDLGFADATPDRHSVTTVRRFEEIEPLLELLDTYQDRLPPDWVETTGQPKRQFVRISPVADSGVGCVATVPLVPFPPPVVAGYSAWGSRFGSNSCANSRRAITMRPFRNPPPKIAFSL